MPPPAPRPGPAPGVTPPRAPAPQPTTPPAPQPLIPAEPPVALTDILTVLGRTGRHSLWLSLLQTAGLTDTVKEAETLTMFAPTDEALGRLPKEQLLGLLKEEQREALTALVRYHILPSRREAAKLSGAASASTLNGQSLGLYRSGSAFLVDGIGVTQRDLRCRNGFVHVLDGILQPSALDLVATLRKEGRYSTFLQLCEQAEILKYLKETGPWTVFAVCDDVFAKMPAGTLASLRRPENKEMLAATLKRHLVAGRYFLSSALEARLLLTANGEMADVSRAADTATVNGISLTLTDLATRTGVVHQCAALLPARASPPR